jgi:hypothetical protein
VTDWRALPEFIQRNPLTVIILVRQALHHRTSARQIETLVAGRRAGSAGHRRCPARPRRPLAASLDYGFTQAFSESEQAQFALLALAVFALWRRSA